MAWHRIWRQCRTFIHPWLRFAVKDATGATFGWAAAPSGAVLLLAAHYWGFSVSPQPVVTEYLLYAAGGALGAWLVAFLWNVVFMAPRKAWLAMNPLRIILIDKISEPEKLMSGAERHIVYIKVENKHPDRSIYCIVSILEIKGIDESRLPWQIYSGNIPANDEHLIPLAYWFLYGKEQAASDIRIINEKPGFGNDATMIQFPESGGEICVRATSPGRPDTISWLRVWAESNRLTRNTKESQPGVLA